MIELIELSFKSRLMAEIEDIKKLREGDGGAVMEKRKLRQAGNEGDGLQVLNTRSTDSHLACPDGQI